ncbi:MAG: MATE family efflux transporter [Candidatus Magasanikbacteria bacterium]|jgi:putative MATE family efflux protein|nr:MATE family efflux transporter [Candidatus Magasanikbacteria bacterium]
MKVKNNLTEGSILSSLLALSVPIIFANLLQTAYQLTDTFWVGRLGTVAVAAVSISFPIIFFIISLGGGLAMAGTILVAQYKGRENKKAVDHVTSQTMVLVVFISIILATLGYVLSPFLISLMGAEPSVFSSAVSYIKISFIGMIFMFTYMAFQSLMRGVGDVKTPMYIVFGTVLLNLILDPLFIFGYGVIPAFGVSGAAVATIGTQGLASIIGIVLLIRGKYQIQLHLNDLKPDWVLIKKMCTIGFPASIDQSTRALGMVVMTFLVTTFGTMTLAAYGIGSRILSFVIIPALGLSIATSTITGQNIGAGKIDRAEKITKLSAFVGFIILTIVGIIMFLFASQISAIFIPGEIETIQSSALFIKIMALTFGFIGIQMSLNGLFRGSGNTMIPMILTIVSLWVLRFPLAYILSKHTALAEIGLWVSFPIANVIAAVITIIWFMKGTWKHKQITEETVII